MRHFLVVLLAAAAVLLLGAGPAAAHGRGSDATNFSSRITSAPNLPGVEWRIYGGDEYLAVSSPQVEVVVLGYEGEPYLRVGPEGVFENRNSAATYLNQERYAEVTVPAGVGPDVPPEWVKVSDESSYALHHHHIHWMAQSEPPAVRDNPGEAVVVNPEWTVPFEVDGQAYEVTGELLWIPPPPVWPWLLGALVVLSVPVLLGLRSQPVDADRWPALARPAAGVLAVVSLANVVHLVDDLVATPQPLPVALIAGVQTLLFIGIGLFSAVRGWQAREGAFTALGVGSAAILVGQGLLYVSVLGASQTASVFPGVVTRAVVAASLAQVVPVAATAVIGTRRLLPQPAPVRPKRAITGSPDA